MSEQSMQELFGELRALLQGDEPDGAHLLPLLHRACVLDPARYLQEWRPYLGGFDLPMSRAETLEALELLGVLLPETAPRTFYCTNGGLEDQIVEMLPTLEKYPCTVLVLYGNAFGNQEMFALANSSALRQVERLDLSSNAIGNEGIGHLAFSAHTSSLRALDLGYNNIEAHDGVLHLMRSPLCQHLQMLDLSYNPLGPEGGLAFASTPDHGESLTVLGLSGCELGEVGLSGLRHAPFVEQLESLYLGFNEVGDEDLSLWPSMPHMMHFHLRHNQLTGRAVNDLARFTALEVLDLTNNPLGPQGAQAIAATAQWPMLHTLNLSHASIGDDGMIALASAKGLSSLRHLVLDFNEISARGLSALAQSDAFPHLEKLDMLHNNLDPSDAHIIRTSTTLPKGLQALVVESSRRIVWEVGSDVS